MMDIRISAGLWASSIAPQGILERWLAPEGAVVAAGQAIAEVRIEDALHELTSPARGCLRHRAAPDDVVEPGSLIADLDPPAI
jgi:pyruvate/2-oxoglutarate dehydrogenase complex dihydrolipoamide acyltransferase (E2) component